MDDFIFTLEIKPKINWLLPPTNHLEEVQRSQMEAKLNYYTYKFFMKNQELFRETILESAKSVNEIINMTDRPK